MSTRKRKAANAPGARALPTDINAAIRAKRALEMILQGHDYTFIAQQCGYASRSGAWMAVHRELARAVRPAAEEVLKMELMRLDAYLTVYAPKAMAGDGWSLDRCLKIAEARRKLLGLEYAPRPHEGDNIAQMVIIGVPPEIAAAV